MGNALPKFTPVDSLACCNKYPKPSVKKSVINFAKELLSKGYTKAIENLLSPCCHPVVTGYAIKCIETGYRIYFEVDTKGYKMNTFDQQYVLLGGTGSQVSFLNFSTAPNIAFVEVSNDLVVGDLIYVIILKNVEEPFGTYTTFSQIILELPTC